MPVYVDNMHETGIGNFGRMKMSHMIADTTDELLAMADAIGVKRKWIQNKGTCGEHFDICLSKRAKAVKLGAKEINFREYATFVEDRAAKHGIPWTHVSVTKIK
jgi:hypothetical protein